MVVQLRLFQLSEIHFWIKFVLNRLPSGIYNSMRWQEIPTWNQDTEVDLFCTVWFDHNYIILLLFLYRLAKTTKRFELISDTLFNLNTFA